MRYLASFLLFATALIGVVSAQGIVNLRHHGTPRRHMRFQPINIDKHHVKTHIVEGIATTTVTQVFRNPNALILEGSYVFPIPENASLTEFTMIMNGKKVVGEVLERDKARGIYEAIVAKQRDPALLEYVGRKLFRARVFPIPAKGTAEVSLTYVEQLAIDAGILEYRYPLKTQAFSKQPVKSLAVQVAVESSSGIQNIFSPSHRIDVAKSGQADRRSVSFEGKQASAGKDFHLLVAMGKKMVACNLLTDFSATDGGFFLLRFAPSIVGTEDRKPIAKDIVFVVDTSGSMRADKKMEQAKRAIIYGLKGLNKGDRFNVVSFSTEARSFSNGLVEFGEKQAAASIQWVGDLQAKGGTNIHDALVGAFPTEATAGRPSMVVFLTDGMPTVGETNVSTIRKAVAKANVGTSRLFVWGVGYDVNTLLLDSLAEENRGVRDYVTPSQDLEIKLSSFFDKISSPVLSNITVKVDGVTMTEIYPRNLPDLFVGGECVILGRYKAGGASAVRLAGIVGDTSKEFVFEKKFAQSRNKERDFVSLLWARRKVGYLLDQIRLNGEQKELKEEVVRLGKKYALATPYTSLLVTEDSKLLADGANGLGGGAGSGFRRLSGRGSRPTPGRNPAESTAKPQSGGAPVGSTTTGGFRRKANAPKTAVDRSLGIKRLREEMDQEVMGESGRLLKKRSLTRLRVGKRTFIKEADHWVDEEIAKMDPKQRKSLTERVDAYSARYFELMRQHPKLAKWMSKLGYGTVLLDGKVIQIVPLKKEAADTPK